MIRVIGGTRVGTTHLETGLEMQVQDWQEQDLDGQEIQAIGLLVGVFTLGQYQFSIPARPSRCHQAQPFHSNPYFQQDHPLQYGYRQ